MKTKVMKTMKTEPVVTTSSQPKLALPVGSIIIGVSILVAAMGLFTLSTALKAYLPKADRYFELMARQDCAQSYRLEYNDQKTQTRIIRPVEDLYQKCLTEKGL